MDGVISYINTYCAIELEIEICIHVNLTSLALWEPHSETLSQERDMFQIYNDMKHCGKSG